MRLFRRFWNWIRGWKVEPVYSGDIHDDYLNTEDQDFILTSDVIELNDTPTYVKKSKHHQDIYDYFDSIRIDRWIEWVIFHCTGTIYNVKVESIIRYWKEEKGWNNPGYHFIIDVNGHWTLLLDPNKIANGVRGINYKSIHISCIGGINQDYPLTEDQEDTLRHFYMAISKKMPYVEFRGHNDFDSGKPFCPGYDVQELIEKWEQ